MYSVKGGLNDDDAAAAAAADTESHLRQHMDQGTVFPTDGTVDLE